MQDYEEKNLTISDLTNQEEDHISGQIDTIIFRNEDNGYTVCGVDGDFQFIAVGTMPELEEGEHVVFYGKWTEHPEYGRQYRVEHYESVLPHTEAGIIAYLSSSLIKGLGPKRAERLVNKYGIDTLEILARDELAAASIKGISPSLSRNVSAQLQEKRQYQDLVMLLSPIGTGPGRIMRIFRKWGSSAVEKIRNNPYCLAEEIEGTGFLTADKLASDLGINPLDDNRLNSAVLYLLSQNISAGHTWSCPDSVIAEAAELVSCESTKPLADAVKRLTAEDKLICCDDTGMPTNIDDKQARLMLPPIYKAERTACERLLLLAGSSPQRFSDWQEQGYVQPLITKKSYDTQGDGFSLSQEQLDKLTRVLSSQVSVLTGGPGTGKTTMIRTLCAFVKSEGGRLILAAPTGRAARRLSEATGEEANTLHRLLALPVNSRFSNTASQIKLQADFVVVDEASMLDVFMFSSLLEAILPGTRLVLAGDADQLPSIGPGQILRDLNCSGVIPVLRLTQIYRQAQRSLIVKNAHQIREGRKIQLDQSIESSFIWIERNSPSDMAEAALQLCARVLPADYQIEPIREAQVLTPVRKGECGASELNKRLQVKLNKTKEADNYKQSCFQVYGREFCLNDKVIQMRNQYELEWVSLTDDERGQGIMNGETGIITAVDTGKRRITVLFDDERQAVYDETALEDLDLAYAVTVHKSQGSEYQAVVLLLPPTAPALLNRQLLYTAVTRARQRLFLISSKSVLQRTIANNSSADRRTMLAKWLSSAV